MKQSKHPRLGNREAFHIVSAGRRVSWKGFEALEEVGRRHPHWKVSIASDLPKEELYALIRDADVFVLNSQYEGLPHILLEVMALAVPIIATRVGGIPELIVDGITGLLISPNDDEALYKALRDVEENTLSATARAVAGYKFIKDGVLMTREEIEQNIQTAIKVCDILGVQP